MKKKWIAILLILAMALPLAACGGGGAGSDTTFTFWIYNGIDSAYYMDYNDNPALKYALSKTYGPEDKSLAFEFWVPPAGTANDNYSVMIGSGDYADIIENTIGDSPLNSYLNGVSLDLTEYVKQYMPNYLAYIDAHPEVKADAVTLVDGEEKYLGVVAFCEDFPASDWGHEYRRDWIVKYGKNPLTGAAFTGGYTDPGDIDSWEDDVVFPSGGSDPLYISDWEWMFDIFETAMADLGIEDGRCLCSGAWCDLSGFRGGGSHLYVDPVSQQHLHGFDEHDRRGCLGDRNRR